MLQFIICVITWTYSAIFILLLACTSITDSSHFFPFTPLRATREFVSIFSSDSHSQLITRKLVYFLICRILVHFSWFHSLFWPQSSCRFFFFPFSFLEIEIGAIHSWSLARGRARAPLLAHPLCVQATCGCQQKCGHCACPSGSQLRCVGWRLWAQGSHFCCPWYHFRFV